MGNVDTNAGVLKAVKYGVTREHIRQLKVVLTDGKFYKFGVKAVKSSSGYSLKDIIIGSEGTLVVVTEVTFRLYPTPKKSINAIIPFPNLEEQQKIGSFFKTLDEKIEQEEKKLETYQSMKKALMQRMFV